MKKVTKSFVYIITLFMLIGTIAYADDSAAILSTHTGSSDFSVYIKGISPDTGIESVQIGVAEADEIETQNISELALPMRTLIMIDNSLSMSSDNRKKIDELLQKIISGKSDNEEIRIAVFGEDISNLTDYTNDYDVLNEAVGSIEYQNRETYLTDVLYDLISSDYIHSSEDIYCRIIVASDGVDNKSLGYTKDELYSLIRDFQIPIYTIGSVNGKNNDELENMFALSRMTSAEYFLLDEINEVSDITEALNKDRGIIKLTIVPPEEILDGTGKNIKIIFSNAMELSAKVTMPQKIRQNVEPKPEPEPLPEPDAEPEPEPVDETGALYKPVFIVIAAILAVVILAMALIAIIKNKNGAKSKDNRDNSKKRDVNREEFEVLHEKIEEDDDMEGLTGRMDIPNEEYDDDIGETTFIMWPSYQIMLTDKNLLSKSFSARLETKPIIVGRIKKLCDIALDYDKEKSVSGRHCEIIARNGRFFVRDLQSTNGTYLNGRRVLAETEIFSGNTLKLGRLEMQFDVQLFDRRVNYQ